MSVHLEERYFSLSKTLQFYCTCMMQYWRNKMSMCRMLHWLVFSFDCRVNTVIDCTGLASYHGFLPTLTRNCIQALTGTEIQGTHNLSRPNTFSFCCHIWVMQYWLYYSIYSYLFLIKALDFVFVFVLLKQNILILELEGFYSFLLHRIYMWSCKIRVHTWK